MRMLRNAAIDKDGWLLTSPPYGKVKHVVTIVISHHIVKLLWFDAATDINVGVDNTFCVLKDFPYLLAGRPDKK